MDEYKNILKCIDDYKNIGECMDEYKNILECMDEYNNILECMNLAKCQVYKSCEQFYNRFKLSLYC